MNLELTEYVPRPAVALTDSEVLAIRRLVPSLSITPSNVGGRTWDLRAGPDVGSVTIGDLHLTIAPKIGMARLLFLLSYAAGQARWFEDEALWGEEPDLVELLLHAFARALQESLRRGVLRGYRTEADSLLTVRGRIDIGEQVRRHFGRVPPIEVRFDDYTEDIIENRILKAALLRCRHLPIRTDSVGRDLKRFDRQLAEVASVEFDRANLPHVEYNRLNQHLRPSVELAKLILRTVSIEQSHRRRVASGLVINMNTAFEDFVVTALREALGLSARAFPQGASGRRVRLDEGELVGLMPDLSWWDGRQCSFVGDVKYKKIAVEGVLHPDLYQLLAYTVALDLPAGMLVYAQGEASDVVHVVKHAGKRLVIHPIDVSGSPRQMLDQIATLADEVRRQREAGRTATTPQVI